MSERSLTRSRSSRGTAADPALRPYPEAVMGVVDAAAQHPLPPAQPYTSNNVNRVPLAAMSA